MLAIMVAPALAHFAGARAQDDVSRGLGMMARPGVNYSIQTVSKFGFRVDDAQYTLRYSSKQEHLVARRGMKLLILKYTLTNKESYSISYSPGTVNLRVISSGGRSSTPTRLGTASDAPEIKGNGSVSETVWAEVPTTEPAPRLEASVSGSSLLKFDLKSFAKPAKGSFVGADGSIADQLKVPLGKRISLGGFDVSVDRLEWTTKSNPFLSLSSGQRALIATVTLENQAPYPAVVGRGVLIPEILTAEGTKVAPSFTVLRSTEDTVAEQEVGPKKSIVVRYAIKIDSGVNPDDLLVTDGVNSGRTLIVDVGR